MSKLVVGDVTYHFKRNWLPWKRRGEVIDTSPHPLLYFHFPKMDLPDGDDPISATIAVFMMIFYAIAVFFLLVLALPAILSLAFVIGELILIALLTPIMIPLRSYFFPWVISIYRNGEIVDHQKIKGWRASSRYIKEVKCRLKSDPQISHFPNSHLEGA